MQGSKRARGSKRGRRVVAPLAAAGRLHRRSRPLWAAYARPQHACGVGRSQAVAGRVRGSDRTPQLKWHPYGLEPYLISAEPLEDSSHKSIAFCQLRFSRQCRFASFPPFLSLFSIVDLQACSLIKRPNRLLFLAPAILPIWPNRLRPGAPIGPRWFLAGRGLARQRILEA